MFTTFGGSAKGICFKDLLCGLVMLTNNRKDEKIKCELMKICLSFIEGFLSVLKQPSPVLKMPCLLLKQPCLCPLSALEMA